ncbi:hypothetical protein NQZ68_026443 [Dissostichus eleginoides]|nr:hypothetical protein NQZ68_026443 [Dissostichus eleginoides]
MCRFKQTRVCGLEQKHGGRDPAAGVDSSSRLSGTGRDSGFGSDSACIRIVQIEQQSGASHHRIARPSHTSTITKNLSFIPFDIFLTASRLSVMTYACSSPPKALPSSSDTPGTPEKKEPGDKVGKSALNQPEILPESPPASTPPTPDPAAVAQVSLAGLTAEDILNSNNSQTASPLLRGSLLSLGGLPTPSRSSARQALGVTIVRQPGRRGVGDQVLEPLLYIQVMQPSALLSCHHRKQRMELSVFDVALRGVPSDYKCLDPGKTLPESLDYNVFWMQTVAGEVDSKTGIPPPLLCLQIKDFLNGPDVIDDGSGKRIAPSPTIPSCCQRKALSFSVDLESHPTMQLSVHHSNPTTQPRSTSVHPPLCSLHMAPGVRLQRHDLPMLNYFKIHSCFQLRDRIQAQCEVAPVFERVSERVQRCNCYHLEREATAELNVELARPLKINPTLAKLEQAKAYLMKVLPNHTWGTSSNPPSASPSPYSSPAKTLPRPPPAHSEASALGKDSVRALALSFHKVSLHTAQIVVVMETEAHLMRPSVTAAVSAMTGSLNMKSGPRIEGPNPAFIITTDCCPGGIPLFPFQQSELLMLIVRPQLQRMKTPASPPIRKTSGAVYLQMEVINTPQSVCQCLDDALLPALSQVGRHCPLLPKQFPLVSHSGLVVYFCDAVQAASMQLQLKDLLLRTGLKERGRVLLGPFSCSSSLEARWCRHSGSPGLEPGPPKLLLDLKGGLLQVFWGQEHLSCLKLVEEHLQAYLNLQRVTESADSCSKGKACHIQPPPSPGAPSPRTEHSSDDLRTGHFQYMQNSASQRLPGPHEVVFCSETEESPGVMLWRYPEPRVLTFVRINPVPFNTTEDPEISTADLGDALQTPAVPPTCNTRSDSCGSHLACSGVNSQVFLTPDEVIIWQTSAATESAGPQWGMDACDCGHFCESVYYTAGDEESLADEHVVFPSFAPFFLNPSGMPEKQGVNTGAVIQPDPRSGSTRGDTVKEKHPLCFGNAVVGILCGDSVSFRSGGSASGLRVHRSVSLQIPCSLEYWDELQQAFVPYREFSLSESRACQLQLPSLSLTEKQKELVASDLWRIVLNSNGEGGDEQSLDSESGSQMPCDQLVSPMALAACTRVDSCFAPWFVPSLGVSLQLAQLDVHLCHHLEQLGTVPSRQLRPFLPDRKLPQEQEFMVTGAREPRVFLRQWSNGPRHCQEFSFSTQLDCKLLEYRNLTHLQLLQPVVLQGQAAATYCPQDTSLDVNVFVDPVFLNISQYAIHTVDTALQSWKQKGNPQAEELVYSHYVICNDTHETLCFGQVDTDENVLLASLHSHQYSWRSHKSPQLLHICIEGWGNWRWSEAFSVDNVGTLLRTIQYKGRTASLIIKVTQLNGVQKQVIICGRQVMLSYLTQHIELRVVQHYVGPDAQTVVREHCDCLEAGAKLPSYVLEDAEMTELCVRARGDEDWSQDVQLERRERGPSSSVVQVPCSSGSLLYVWCTLFTIEADTHMQQRVVVFSPLFVMRSHLPDPVILHVEKRSLGLRESQLIQGQGHQEPLLNTEADLTHHLTFQARHDEDASHCAVPISTSLIKQIVHKNGNEDNLEHILDDFYGPKTSTGPPWPYVAKDTDRSVLEPLAQWDSPMQVKLSCWKSGLNTLLVELLPWALLANHSKWDLWLFEGETIVLQIPAGKIIVPPNFKEAFQIGIYWAHTNTVHKSTALKLVHDLTSPRWKEGSGSEVVTLDEEGYVEADITLGAFPGRQKLCQFCVSSVVRHGIQILQLEDRTILVNNTPHTIQYRPLLTDHALGTDGQACEIPETAQFSLAPSEELSRPCSVLCWDLLQTSVQGALEFPLPLRYMLLRLLPKPDGGVGSAGWSLPAPIRSDFPRQSVSVPGEAESVGGLSSRSIVLTYQEHLGVTYIILNEDPCPRMVIHNKCPIPLMLKETVKETARTEVYCRPLPANCSLHHELYHHLSSFPECRQKEMLPTLLLKTTSDHSSTDWTDPIDIKCPGTQVVFLPGFGCLYIDVLYEKGTLVLCLAPEGGLDAVIHQHSSSPKASCRVLLSEASVVLSDDITNPSGSVELLRLTLTKLLLSLAPAPPSLPQEQGASDLGSAHISLIEVYCSNLQIDNQLYNRASFHFPVLLCQDQRSSAEPGGGPWSSEANPTESPEALEEFKRSCFLQLRMRLAGDRCNAEEITFQLQPARVYLEDTFVYYVKTLFHTYIPDSAMTSAPAEPQRGTKCGSAPILPEQVLQAVQALVHPVRLQRLSIQPVNLLVSIHASLKLYIASDHTPLSFSLFERGPLCTTARQLVHALAMHYAAGALFRAGWVVGSLEILGSPASLVRSIGNGVSDFFRLPYEGLTRGPGAFVSGVSRGTTSFVKHISKGTLTSITNLATSLARNMDRLSLDEEHYTRQEEWRRQLPESLGDGLRQGLSRLGISLLGAIAGIVDQPMQNFQRNWETQSSAGSHAKGVISGVGKGIVGVFTKPIGGAAELVSQTGYGILHGAGLWQLPKQLYLPTEEKSCRAPNSHLKYVWKMLQSLGRPELHMALEVTLVSGSGQEHAGCLLLTSEVLFVVSLSEDTQQQAFPITEVVCQQELGQGGLLSLTLQQQTVASDTEGDGVRERLTEQQYRRLVDYVLRAAHFLSPSTASLQLQLPVTLAEPPPSVTKSYRYLVDPAFAKVFVSKFTMVKNKALHIGFH